MSPSDGVSRPAMQRSVVVLPHPLGPRRTTNSLSRISRSSPLTATAPSYDLESPCSLTRAKVTSDGEERINNLRLPLAVAASEMTAIHGSDVGLTPDMQANSRHFNELNAADFKDEYDYVIIHDPQPAPFATLCERKGKWIWRCHIDLTSPNKSVLRLLAPHLEAYDAAVFSAREYAPPTVRFPRIYVNPPAIDPTSPKNRHVYREEFETILPRFDVDFDRPVISQVGRFDPWKDPLGVIDAYRLVKKKIPKVQLLLVASMARDDPEGWLWFERSARHAGDDPDIHFLTDLRGVGALEVNALQRQTDVSIAKSLREGFGLIVSESLWKNVPIVGGDVTGIRLQIKDGRHGYLVSSVRECADRTIELLRSPGKRKTMGKAGRERVRKHFLITRYLREYLRIFSDLAAGS